MELDGLRGWAAITVAIFHTVLYVEPSQIQRIHEANWSGLHDSYSVLSKLFFTVFDGMTAVFIFFVLSGAVLFKSLMADDGAPQTLPLRFYTRRIFRIYPALVVCLALYAVVIPEFGRGVTLQQMLENVALVSFQVNPVTWTLNAEMIAPAFILLAFFGYRRGRELGLVAVLAAISIVFRSQSVHKIFPYFQGAWLCFAFGALVPTRIGAWIAKVLPRHSWLVVLVAVVFLRATLQHAAIAILVTQLYYGRAGDLGRWLSLPLSRFMGAISFSFYLFNMIVVEIVCAKAATLPLTRSHPIEVGVVCSLVVILLSIPVSYASWAYIEMPLNRFGRWLTSGRARRATEMASKASA